MNETSAMGGVGSSGQQGAGTGAAGAESSKKPQGGKSHVSHPAEIAILPHPRVKFP